jgi:hypothetical protein
LYADQQNCQSQWLHHKSDQYLPLAISFLLYVVMIRVFTECCYSLSWFFQWNFLVNAN